VGTEIFFGKPEKRLDNPINKPPDVQISGRSEAMGGATA
jgi:hypothetical protein